MNERYEQVLQVLVAGRVQGVWYRGWTVDNAKDLGLNGWVRNLRDGRVEAVLAGPRAAIDEMLERMRIGPPAAAVDSIETHAWSEEVRTGFRQVGSA